MSKLHELLAVETNLRQQSEATRNDLKTTFDKKRNHFQELLVTFKPTKEREDLKEREESRLNIQTTITKELEWIQEKIVKAMDASHQIDIANTTAKEDVVLEDGTIILKAIPATSLLQLEKRLKEVMDLIGVIPTLDPAKGFAPDKDRGTGIYKARDVLRDRTEKTYKVLLLAPATEKHAAQVEKYAVDEKVGEVLQQEWSSLITVTEKGDMLDRVEELIRAVKKARSRANDQEIDVKQNKIGGVLLDYVFKGKK